MRHILRRTSLLLVPLTLTALVVGIPTAASDTDLQDVTLTCTDGTDLNLTLDTTALTELTDAVDAMTLFPAGDPPLSCSVIQSPLLAGTTMDSSRELALRSRPRRSPIRRHARSWIRKLSASGNPNWDYSVGGVTQFHFPPFNNPCQVNVSMSARAPSNSPTDGRGMFNADVPGGCGGGGKLRVDINCVDVLGNVERDRGTVREATGSFAFDGFTVGGNAFIRVHDMGRAPTDEVGFTPTSGGVGPCGGSQVVAQTTNGNLTVHDAEP